MKTIREPWRECYDLHRLATVGGSAADWNSAVDFKAGFEAGMLNRAAVLGDAENQLVTKRSEESAPRFVASLDGGWRLYFSPRAFADPKPYALFCPDDSGTACLCSRFSAIPYAMEFYHRSFQWDAEYGMHTHMSLPLPDADDEGRERWSPGWRSPLALILTDFGNGWSLWNSPRDAGDRRPFVLSNPDAWRGGTRFKNRSKAESFYRRRIVGEVTE
jgi:hypothetical protein